MNMTAGVMLLVVVAVVVVLAGAGAVWAIRAAPQSGRRTPRKPRERTRTAPSPGLPAGGVAAATVAAAAAPAAERTLAQSDEERIEAMRALLNRGDERARRLAESGDEPAFADTQAFDDPDPPTLPLDWSHSKPGPTSKPPSSGHIPL